MKCDNDSKIIADFSVTDTSIHDSQEFAGFIYEKDYDVKADSGYGDEKFREEILAKYPHGEMYICAKAFRNTPLTNVDKE